MSNFQPRRYVARYTSLHLVLASCVLVFTWGFIALATFGLGLLAPLFGAIMLWWRTRYLDTLLRGSGIRVDENQFPEIYESAQRMSRQLGLRRCPELYILEDNRQNAFAFNHWTRRYVILIDDIVFGAQATGNPKVLDFILGHELAHHALGHTDLWRRCLSAVSRTLSRLDELSCDAVSHALNQDSQAARDALCLLLVGPQLYPRINRAALDQQAEALAGSSSTREAEREFSLTHPLLLHRYARLRPALKSAAPALAALAEPG